MKTSDSKARLPIRLSEAQRGLLERAAELEGLSVTEFVRGAALTAARELLREAESVKGRENQS